MLEFRNNCLLQEVHILRKQIRIIRKRILIRKYGYLFFRKTISNILPSIARSHYLFSVKRNAFLRLKTNWYKERIEWKYNLRAKLHYNFVVKKKYFQQLTLFHVKKKTKRVKVTIAQVMFEKNFKKQLLKFSFVKWKRYVDDKRNKTLKNQIADQHFKFKYQNEQLKPFFVKWIIFTLKTKKIKAKMANAHKLYNNSLLSRTFNAFFLYIQYKKLRKTQIEEALQFYSRKLMKRMFCKLISYRAQKLSEKGKKEFVDLVFHKRLLKRCMTVLLKNVIRNKFKRDRIFRFHELQSVRKKKFILDHWKYYVLYKRQKQEKFRVAVYSYDFHNKKKCFQKLKMYSIYKKRKRSRQILMITKIKSIFQKIILNYIFDCWRYFSNIRIIKKEKIALSHEHFMLGLRKKIFYRWLNFKDYKKKKRFEILELDIHFKYRLMKSSFIKWKDFINEKRLYCEKLADAKKYYRDNLIRANFRLIIKTASRIKEKHLVHYLENEKNRMTLAQKYLTIWKIKSKYSKLHTHIVQAVRQNMEEEVEFHIVSDFEKLTTTSDQRKESLFYSLLDFTDVFQWDAKCFDKPRVPDYMNY
ncbi:hypothetical protein WA026_008650 [Henosepilachna vigintioctopunctata]|uniref:Sfi1 spindle body domain-containing protein n=1 Tax=Henosepilachna vigintioctopunctata TaxID=420089 RepID=A0AAW1UC60_9CUCU